MPGASSRRWWALIAMALSLLVIGLDSTVLNVALPTMALDLHASTSQLQWFADAYLLVMSALLLPAGLLGDKYGRKKLTIGALTVFGAGSMWCAFAGSATSLIGARVLLGIGAAVLIPLVMSSVVVLFEPDERPKAIGVIGAATIVGLPAGPLVGGALLNHFWWGSVFLINVPVIAIALIAASVLLPKDGPSRPGAVDHVGVGLSAAGLVGLTYGLIEGPVRGWTSAPVMVALIGGIALLTAFVRWEARIRAVEPLMELGLWRNTSFRWGVVGATLANFGLFGVMFVLPQYFRSVTGVDALGTGVRTLPLLLGMIVGLQGGMRLAKRIGFARSATIGFVGSRRRIGRRHHNRRPYRIRGDRRVDGAGGIRHRHGPDRCSECRAEHAREDAGGRGHRGHAGNATGRQRHRHRRARCDPQRRLSHEHPHRRPAKRCRGVRSRQRGLRSGGRAAVARPGGRTVGPERLRHRHGRRAVDVHRGVCGRGDPGLFVLAEHRSRGRDDQRCWTIGACRRRSRAAAHSLTCRSRP